MSAGSEDTRLSDFERGAAIEVPVDRIESELAALWRHAAEAKPGAVPRAVTRACLWNLIIRVHGEQPFVHVKRLVDDLSQRLPARTIVCRIEREQADGLRAWVEANWRRREGSGEASGSDEVTLWAGGRQVERLPSLLRALLYSDAPTAVFWSGDMPEVTTPTRELIHQADRLVVDSRKFEDERRLSDLCRLGADDPELELADLSWLGISPLRGMCASLFDPPRDSSVLARIDRARVVSNIEGTQARGLLALGWLMARLGWSKPVRQPDGDGGRRWRATRADGKPVALELATQKGDQERHGVAGLELSAGQETWSLTRDTCIHVHGPDLPPRTQPARSHSDAELLASALGARGRDPMYKQALAAAVQLVEARS